MWYKFDFYTFTCIYFQIRLTNGQALTQSFSAKEPLSAVRVYVQMSGSDTPDNFTFMTTFPRKVFTPEDFDKSISALGKNILNFLLLLDSF